MNVEGNPVFLRAEVQQEKIFIPEFIEVIRNVTDDDFFTSKNMATKEYVFIPEVHGQK